MLGKLLQADIAAFVSDIDDYEKEGQTVISELREKASELDVLSPEQRVQIAKQIRRALDITATLGEEIAQIIEGN